MQEEREVFVVVFEAYWKARNKRSKSCTTKNVTVTVLEILYARETHEQRNQQEHKLNAGLYYTS